MVTESEPQQPLDMDNTTGRSLLENRLSNRHKTNTIVLRLGPTIGDNNRLLYQQCSLSTLSTLKTSCRKGEFRPKITIKVCARLFNSLCLGGLLIIWRSYNVFCIIIMCYQNLRRV